MVNAEDIDQLSIIDSFQLLSQQRTYEDERDDKGDLVFPDLAETYKRARFGILIRFDIYDYIYELVKIKEKTGQISYRGRTYNLTDFWTELEKRNILIKKWLKNNLQEENIFGTYQLKKTVN